MHRLDGVRDGRRDGRRGAHPEDVRDSCRGLRDGRPGDYRVHPQDAHVDARVLRARPESARVRPEDARNGRWGVLRASLG